MCYNNTMCYNNIMCYNNMCYNNITNLIKQWAATKDNK
jgi:hypothetical protein